MIELLEQMNHWHWLTFGFALLALEILGTAGYFLWLGISALIVGTLYAFVPIDWSTQWIIFGVLSLITTWLWWKKQSQKDNQGDSERDLNQKQKQLIGQTTVLDEDLPHGKGRIRISDSSWPAKCDEPLTAGSKVRVIDVQGIMLIVEKID
ncbi:NfeD family protein [Vibrio profundum]|uniref:NfeD family protein n=1 Tax=Vibrio profundum TaxID=2910247 RepID=UPI003D0A05DF